MYFQPEEKYRLADPICTFLFSILVLFTTVTVLRDTLHVIMEGMCRFLMTYEIGNWHLFLSEDCLDQTC